MFSYLIMIVNKKCPFCKRFLRKEIARFTNQNKIFCHKCDNKFLDIDNKISFIYNKLIIKIENNCLTIIDKDESYSLHKNFNIYTDINEIISKIQLLIFK